MCHFLIKIFINFETRSFRYYIFSSFRYLKSANFFTYITFLSCAAICRQISKLIITSNKEEEKYVGGVYNFEIIILLYLLRTWYNFITRNRSYFHFIHTVTLHTFTLLFEHLCFFSFFTKKLSNFFYVITFSILNYLQYWYLYIIKIYFFVLFNLK